MLQVSKRVYIPGTLKHTGEYMVNVKGYPASYSILQTAEGATDYLQRKLAGKSSITSLKYSYCNVLF